MSCTFNINRNISGTPSGFYCLSHKHTSPIDLEFRSLFISADKVEYDSGNSKEQYGQLKGVMQIVQYVYDFKLIAMDTFRSITAGL